MNVPYQQIVFKTYIALQSTSPLHCLLKCKILLYLIESTSIRPNLYIPVMIPWTCDEVCLITTNLKVKINITY